MRVEPGQAANSARRAAIQDSPAEGELSDLAGGHSRRALTLVAALRHPEPFLSA
jgi:hypothetical protein